LLAAFLVSAALREDGPRHNSLHAGTGGSTAPPDEGTPESNDDAGAPFHGTPLDCIFHHR
jgi:hypothetical protein